MTPRSLSRAFAGGLVLLAAFVLVAPGPVHAQIKKGGWHMDARFGFKVKPPKKWISLPPPSAQAWVVGRYLSDKAYFFTEQGGRTYDFKPEVTIVAFVSEELKKAERKRQEKEAEQGYVPERIDMESAYRDYKDYFTKTYTGGGFYFSREDAHEHDDICVTIYEAKVEKMARSGPKRVVTWVYELQDVDIAIQIEVLEQDFKELSRQLDKIFRSFEVIPRTEEMPILQGQAGGGFILIEMIEKMSPEERMQMRISQQEQAHLDALQGLGEEWHHSKIGRFLVISKADEKYDKRVAGQVGAVFDWLDATFPYIGRGEYVREPIIRICRDSDEEWSYRKAGGSDLRGNGLEITTNRMGGGTRSFEFEYMNRRVAEIWFRDRDRELWWALPTWLQSGILNVVANSTAKRGKLDFYRDSWAMEKMRELIREDSATDPRQLMHLTDSEFMSSEGTGAWGRMSEAQLFVSYLLVGDGRKKKESKGLVENYIRNLEQVIAELEEAEGAEGVDYEPPQTEEEEEARLKARKDEWKQREKELTEEVGSRTFGGWTDKEWDRLSKNYFKSL